MSIPRKKPTNHGKWSAPLVTRTTDTPPGPVTVTVVIEHLTLDDIAHLLPANDALLPAPWTEQASAIFDWLLQAEDEVQALHTTLRQLRRAIEEAAL